MEIDDLIPPALLRDAVATGELRGATRGRVVNSATRADHAEAAAVVVTEDGHGLHGRVVDTVIAIELRRARRS